LNQEDTIEVLSVLLQSLKNKGLKKTINLLKGEKSTEIHFDDDTKFIVDSVCNEFDVSFNDIVNSKYSRGEKKYIIGFIVYYLYQYTSLNAIQKSIFTTLTKALLSTYKQLIFDLDKDKIHNDKFISIKKKLDNKILKIK
jgi:hypothetical protein